MTGPAVGQQAMIERYLAEVAGCLPGPRRARAAIVAEFRSGLLDAADAYHAAGLSPVQAAGRAVAEFGDPAEVAAAFRPEIAASQARRVVLIVLVTGPLVGLLWVATALTSDLGIRFAPPWHWTGVPPELLAGLCLVAVAVAVTAWAIVVGIVTTGRLTRWLVIRPRRAPTAAAIAGFGAVGADALGLALLAAELIAAPGRLSPLLAAAATAASIARIVLARRGAQRCLALRSVLALDLESAQSDRMAAGGL
jgi:hypothetical protein